MQYLKLEYCRHLSKIISGKCLAGIEYKSVRLENQTLPCFGYIGEATCPQYETESKQIDIDSNVVVKI